MALYFKEKHEAIKWTTVRTVGLPIQKSTRVNVGTSVKRRKIIRPYLDEVTWIKLGDAVKNKPHK